MNDDTELEVWRRQWQSSATVPPDLQRRVKRQSLSIKIGLICEIMVTVIFGGAVTAWAARSTDVGRIVLAAGTWVYIAIAWTFGLIVKRGTWSPSSQSTAAFIDLSVRRCRGGLAAVWFAAVMFLCQLAFILGWVHHYSPAHLPPLSIWLFFSSIPIDIVWACTTAFFAFLLWYRRRKQAELAWLLGLREQMPCATV